MKITNIDRDKENHNIYLVTKTPNAIERLFGYTERIEKFKDTHSTYTFGGGHVYKNQKGEKLGNHWGWGSDIREAIDQWRDSW